MSWNKFYSKSIVCDVFLLSFIFFAFPHTAAASVLFSDNFNGGRSDLWTEYVGINGSWVATSDGYYQATVTAGGIPTISFVGDDSWGNYSLSYKTRGILGVDKQVYFRYTTPDKEYYLLNLINGIGAVLLRRYDGGPNIPVAGTYMSLTNNKWYDVKIEASGSQINVFIDGAPVLHSIDNSSVTNGKIALMAWTGSSPGTVTSVQYDDVVVESLETAPPSPTSTPIPTLTPTPAPTPTPTLTPTPTPTSINVPHFLQKDPKWSGVEYDTAHQWATASAGIGRWGCALTSVAMVFRYYGINKGPDGSEVNPPNLNKWLLNEPSGYVNGGYVNWWGLRRFTQEASQLNNSDILDFRKYSTFDTAALDSHLQSAQPDILGVKNNGHYVVATQKEGSSYVIKDPSGKYDSLSGYGNAASSIEHYYPTHTNLSALYLASDPNTEFYLAGPQGFVAGQNNLTHYISIPSGGNYGNVGPLLADSEPNGSGLGIKELAAPIPPEGSYTLSVWSPNVSVFTLDLTGYNQMGTPSATLLTALTDSFSPQQIKFNYNQTDSGGFGKAVRVVTWQTLLHDVRRLMSLGITKNKGLLTSLGKIIALIEAHSRTGNIKSLRGDMNSLRAILNTTAKNNAVNSGALEVIFDDLRLLGY